MRALFLVYFIISILSCSRYECDIITTKYECDNIKSEEEWLDYLCSGECGGRKSGTLGSQNACRYIVSQLENLGYSPVVNEFTHSDGTLLRNITVCIKGESDSLIVIGAHYDGQHESNSKAHYSAANDNASGVVALMSFLKTLTPYQSSYYSLNVCFWDGEEAIIQPPFKGSKFYVNTSQRNIMLYINCDTIGYGEELYIKFSKYSEALMDICSDFIDYDQQIDYHVLFTDLFTSDDFSFYSSKIPTIGITDGSYPFLRPQYPIHTIYDTTDKISVAKLKIVANLIQNIITKLNLNNLISTL